MDKIKVIFQHQA